MRVVREIIGKRIVALAAKGERDPERLCNSALVAAGLRPLARNTPSDELFRQLGDVGGDALDAPKTFVGSACI